MPTPRRRTSPSPRRPRRADPDQRHAYVQSMQTRVQARFETSALLRGLGAAQRASLATELERELSSLLLLTSTEVATLLVVSDDTVSLWCRDGSFPGAISLGRAGWRIPLESLLAFRDARLRPGAHVDDMTSVDASLRDTPARPHFDTAQFASWRTER